MFTRQNLRSTGHLTRYRDEWELWLVQMRRLAFGYYLDHVQHELVLIAGSRLVKQPAGLPFHFEGGFHLKLCLDRWFSWLPPRPMRRGQQTGA